MVALLKHEKFSVLANEYATKGAAGSNSDEQQQLSYAYFLYGSEKYEECLKYLASCSFQTLPFLLLSSQAQNKLQNYAKSAELYVNILKKFPKADDYTDILVNAMASAISSGVKHKKKVIDVVICYVICYMKRKEKSKNKCEF